MKGKQIVTVLKETASSWKEDNVARLAAALAFYTLLSIAPLLVLAVSIAGLVLDEEAARGQIAGELSRIVGPQGGAAIQTIIENARAPGSSIMSALLGLGALLFGASGVFGELQSALNTIWEVKPKPGRGVLGFIKQRFFSFGMVLAVAFLLLVSLVLSTALAAVGTYLSSSLPGGAVVWELLNAAFSLATVTVLFALIFKVVPDVEIQWRDVWVGAVVTAVLFTLGKTLLGLYLGRTTAASPHGAAGSVVLLVIWVYYSAQIVFLGAEFTQVYAKHFGKRIRPDKDAVPVTEDERAQQGMARPQESGAT
jgi:membrane protein